MTTAAVAHLADEAVVRSVLHARRAELERAVNELEFEIRTLCEKQRRALALARQIEELICEGEGA